MTKEQAKEILWDRCQHTPETAEAIRVLSEERPQGDLISREALKAYARTVICGNNPTNTLIIRMFDEIIDNAPAVKEEFEKP